ncbi:MAG: YhgE/Pip family protein, partial [Coriobacteriia bacterium]|nr:YhgE/Pip family protein [Coriobacteriia bacterium]
MPLPTKKKSIGTAAKATLAGVVLVPTLCAGFYASTQVTPLAHLNELPVAVVNSDTGATINKEQRNLGNEVIEKLKSQPADNSLGWKFVSKSEAERGLNSGDYYMICELPSDFSSQIASADTSNPEKSQINVTYDRSGNLLVNQIGQIAWEKMVKQVNESVVEEYFDTVFNKIDGAGEQLQPAVDGAVSLYDGMSDAQEGSGTITTNLYKVVEGSSDLK